MDVTKIEWADSTFNPWEGCTKVGPGCDHCYAEARNARYAGGQAIHWGPGAPRRRTSTQNWKNPLRWEADAAAFQAKHGRRRRVFCASLADVFDNEVDPAWREDLFALIQETPSLDWLLLTKRIGNVERLLPAMLDGVLPRNVWLGATVVDQGEVERDMPKLLAVPATVRFLSIEPMLGPIDFYAASDRWHRDGFTPWSNGPILGGINWVIAGGESGGHARPSHPEWYRALRDQCDRAGVAFLFKQWGEYAPSRTSGPPLASDVKRICDQPVRVGKKSAGRLLDGVEHNGFPNV